MPRTWPSNGVSSDDSLDGDGEPDAPATAVPTPLRLTTNRPIGALFLELSYEAPPNVELNPTGAPRSRLARKAREPHLVRRAGGLTPALAREERLSV